MTDGMNMANGVTGGTKMADEDYMREALALARQGYELGEVPIGAVIVCDGQIVASAHNLKEARLDPTAHAEMVAITAATQALGRWRLTGCTMYVTIEPCAMCAGALVLARIDRLVYGAADPKAGAVGSVMDIVRHERLNHRVEVTGGVLAGECGALMSTFFQARRGG